MKVAFIFMSVWLVSSVALSNGSNAPELPILVNAKASVEYPILKKLQDLTLELQLLEITVKNRRDQAIEEKISTAIRQIEEQGAQISERFKNTRKDQLAGLWALFELGRRFDKITGVQPAEWEELLGALRDGQIIAGMITVHGRGGTLNLVSLTPLYIGKQFVWNVQLPQADRKSFWVQTRARAHFLGYRTGGTLADASLAARALAINAPYADAEKTTKEFFNTSYGRLYSAFETQRYAILQRVQMARKALTELEKNNTAMGTPEQYSHLYNQVLENLFSYGVDVSLSGAAQRDFAVKGFLFAESPERSQELLKRLKYTPSVATYNPPST